MGLSLDGVVGDHELARAALHDNLEWGLPLRHFHKQFCYIKHKGRKLEGAHACVFRGP